MTSKLKLLVATGFVTAALTGANPVWAAGTTAGTDITNNVSVAYQVGGVSQTAQTDSVTFKVDRKVNFVVVERTPTGTTTVVPGSSAQVTSFTVTNTSNAVFDFNLAASQLIGGTAAHGGTDNFDVTGLAVFVDVNNNGTYEAGTDTQTFIDELAADASKTVFIIGNIPGARANGDVAGVTLTATVREGGVASTQGATITPATDSTVNDAATMETVFADTGRNGVESAGDDFTVSAALLSVTKLSRVVSDGVSSTNPKAVPGAVVEYCIVVANAVGGAQATGISVTDNLNALTNVSYDSSFGVKIDGTAVTGNSCTAGTANGAYNTGTKIVSGTLANINAGEQRTLVFRVMIN